MDMYHIYRDRVGGFYLPFSMDTEMINSKTTIDDFLPIGVANPNPSSRRISVSRNLDIDG